MDDFAIFDVVTGANDGFKLELLTPQGNKSGVVFELLGEDSDVVQELVAEQRRVRMERLRERKIAPTDDDNRRDLAEQLVAATKGWTGPEGFRPFSKEAARELYNDRRYVTINDQVIAAISDRRNFTKG